MWVTKLLISPEKKGFFAQKDQIWPKIGIVGQFGAGKSRRIRCPVGGSVGGCVARAVSRKTPIYFMFYAIIETSSIVSNILAKATGYF